MEKKIKKVKKIKAVKVWALCDSDLSISYWGYRNDWFKENHCIAGIFMKRKEAIRFKKDWQSSSNKYLKIIPVLITPLID